MFGRLFDVIRNNKTQETPKGLLTVGWMKDVWSINTAEYYTAMKKRGGTTAAGRKPRSHNTTLSKRSEAQIIETDRTYMIFKTTTLTHGVGCGRVVTSREE